MQLSNLVKKGLRVVRGKGDMKISGNQLRLKGGQSSTANGIDGGSGGDHEDRRAIEAGQRLKAFGFNLAPRLGSTNPAPLLPPAAISESQN